MSIYRWFHGEHGVPGSSAKCLICCPSTSIHWQYNSFTFFHSILMWFVWVFANNFPVLDKRFSRYNHHAFLYHFICIYFKYLYIPFPFRKVDKDWRHNDDNQISWMLQVNSSKHIVLQEKDDNEWIYIFHIFPGSVQKFDRKQFFRLSIKMPLKSWRYSNPLILAHLTTRICLKSKIRLRKSILSPIMTCPNEPVVCEFPSQRPVSESFEQTVEQTIGAPVIWDAISLIMASL